MKFLSGFCFWTKLGEADLILNNFVCLFASDKLWKLNWTELCSVFLVATASIHWSKSDLLWLWRVRYWHMLPKLCRRSLRAGNNSTNSRRTNQLRLTSLEERQQPIGNNSVFFPPSDVDPFGAEVRNLRLTVQANIGVTSDPCRLAALVALPRH